VTRSAFWRMTRAMPAISSTVSPLRRRAVTKAPNWAGVASPDMISSMTAAASSSERELPSMTLAIDSLIITTPRTCPRASGDALSMGDPVRVGDIGAVAVTWALFVPPARPRAVLGNQGDTPWNPHQRGQAPSGLPRGHVKPL